MTNLSTQILLIEDDHIDAEMVKRSLGRGAGEITHVVWLEVGLQRLHQRAFDLVMLDLSLPDSRGLDGLRKITTAAPEVPVIVLTGFDDEVMAVQAVREGAQEYLVKDDINKKWLRYAIRHSIERKRLQVALSQSQSTNQALLKAVPDRMFRVRNDGACLPLFQRLATPSQEQGDNLAEMLPKHAAAQALEAVATALSDGEVQVFEYQTHGDVDMCDYEARITAVSNDEALVMLRDITKQRRLERRVTQAQTLSSVGRLAGGMAHEINTPLQVVSNAIDFVRESFDELSQLVDIYTQSIDSLSDSKQYANQMDRLKIATDDADLDFLRENVPNSLTQLEECTERMAILIKAMKDFGSSASKEKDYADINSALANTLTVTQSLYKQVADVQTDYGSLPKVLCHLGDLQQVFVNLITNAAQAIAAREVDGKGTIRVMTSCEEGVAIILIKDTGVGISAEDQARIYEPFFTTRDVGQGAGMGLSVVHSIVVEKHGGNIDCRSRVGEGTTFAIYIPVEGKVIEELIPPTVIDQAV